MIRYNDCKIRIHNAEEAKRIQEKLFSEGLQWGGSRDQKIRYLNPLEIGAFRIDKNGLWKTDQRFRNQEEFDKYRPELKEVSVSEIIGAPEIDENGNII